MAALKSTLPSVVFLLATFVIISGTSRATGQDLADEVVKEIQYLGVIIIDDASNMLRGVASGMNSGYSAKVGLNKAGSSAESEPNSRVARLASRSNSLSSAMQVSDGGVREELENFGIKVIKHCRNFFDKFPEVAIKVEGGLSQKNQAHPSISSDPNSKVARSVSRRNKGDNNRD